MNAVLHVIDKLSMEGRHPSSCTLMIARWAAGLRPRGYRIDAAVLRPRDAVAEALEGDGLAVIPIPYGSLSPRNVPALARLIRAGGYGIVHLHGYGAANHGRLAARWTGIRSVVHEHAVLPVRPHQWFVDRLLRRWTDAAVAVSEEVRDFMRRGRSLPAAAIRVIPNGIDLDRFTGLTPTDGVAWRQRWGIAATAPLIGTVTRLHPMKGNRFLLESVPAVLARFPEARWVFVGDGPEKNVLEQMARSLGVASAVVFPGFVAGIPAVYAALDVFVLPSLQEGFGLAALEAMAAGNPAVVTATGGLPRLVSDGVNGLLAPPGDAAALADGVIRLLADPSLADRIGRRARLDSQAYGIDRTLQALDRLYTELLVAHPHRRWRASSRCA